VACGSPLTAQEAQRLPTLTTHYFTNHAQSHPLLFLRQQSPPPRITPSYWRQGALVGALTLALVSQAYLSLADEGTYTTGERVRFSLIMAIPGGVIGALVGGQIRKSGS
jgi:hypothetical protein